MTPLINKSLSQPSHAAQAAFDQAVVTLLGERRYDHAWQLLGEHATEAGRLSGRLAAQLLTDADTKILLQDTTVTGRVVASALAAQAPATAVWRDKKRFATLCQETEMLRPLGQLSGLFLRWFSLDNDLDLR